jgi:hypothetical protein
VAPFSSKPAVIVIQPADHSADVECTVHGIEYVGRPWHSRAIGNSCTFDDRPEELGAFFEAESLEAAAQGVQEDEAGSVELNRFRTELIIEITWECTARSESIL